MYLPIRVINKGHTARVTKRNQYINEKFMYIQHTLYNIIMHIKHVYYALHP